MLRRWATSPRIHSLDHVFPKSICVASGQPFCPKKTHPHMTPRALPPHRQKNPKRSARPLSPSVSPDAAACGGRHPPTGGAPTAAVPAPTPPPGSPSPLACSCTHTATHQALLRGGGGAPDGQLHTPMPWLRSTGCRGLFQRCGLHPSLFPALAA